MNNTPYAIRIPGLTQDDLFVCLAYENPVVHHIFLNSKEEGFYRFPARALVADMPFYCRAHCSVHCGGNAVCMQVDPALYISWEIYICRFPGSSPVTLAFPISPVIQVQHSPCYRFRRDEDGRIFRQNLEDLNTQEEDVTDYRIENQVEAIKKSIREKNEIR